MVQNTHLTTLPQGRELEHLDTNSGESLVEGCFGECEFLVSMLLGLQRGCVLRNPLLVESAVNILIIAYLRYLNHAQNSHISLQLGKTV